jgi:hypothetical protein
LGLHKQQTQGKQRTNQCWKHHLQNLSQKSTNEVLVDNSNVLFQNNSAGITGIFKFVKDLQPMVRFCIENYFLSCNVCLHTSTSQTCEKASDCVQSDIHDRLERYLVQLMKFQLELLQKFDFVDAMVIALLEKKQKTKLSLLFKWHWQLLLPNFFSSEFDTFVEKSINV